MNKFFLVATLIYLFTHILHAQDGEFKMSGYVDAYYAYDFNKPVGNEKQHVTQAVRHNEVNINLALIKASYESDRVRSSLALQTGTYPSYNYAEPTELGQMINEANVGFRVNDWIWIDAGVMGGHFGYESVFSIDNEVYSQAMSTEYTPYFQTGLMVSGQLTESLLLKLVVLNGWQNIYETNDAKSVGMGLNYILNDNIEISYGNYYGNEGNDIVGKKMRFHNNAYISYNSDAISSTLQLDVTRQELFNSDQNGTTFMVTWINRYQITDDFGIGARYEYVSDPDKILFSTIAPGFHTNIITGSLNYYPVDYLAIKAEPKIYYGKEDIWTTGDEISNSTFMLNFGMAIRF